MMRRLTTKTDGTYPYPRYVPTACMHCQHRSSGCGGPEHCIFFRQLVLTLGNYEDREEAREKAQETPGDAAGPAGKDGRKYALLCASRCACASGISEPAFFSRHGFRSAGEAWNAGLGQMSLRAERALREKEGTSLRITASYARKLTLAYKDVYGEAREYSWEVTEDEAR